MREAAAQRLTALRPALPALGGLLAATGQAPFSALWLALPGLALMLALIDRAAAGGLRPAAIAGWWAGLGYFALALVWIVQPFFVDPVRHGWMSPFAILLLCGGLALFWGAAAGFAAWAGGTARWRRLTALVLALTAAEMLRSYVLTGFPWALVGHVWIGWPGMQWASLGGPHLLTLLALVPAALAVPLRPNGLAVAAVLVAGVLAGGGWLAGRPPPPATGFTVRLVQPNVAQSLKWDQDTALDTYDGLLALTAQAPQGPRPDLIVWPESALPYFVETAGPITQEIAAAAGGRRLLIGALRVEGEQVMNSVLELSADGAIPQVYDKHHPVPFGEYLPFAGLLERIGLGAIADRAGRGFTAGPGPQLLDLGSLGAALPLICYEAIFPQGITRAPGRPAMLVNVTNDAWFGTFSGPYQHFAQARLRAVETGLPMLRAANTGISGVIGPRGEVLDSLPLGTRGVLDLPLPAPLPPTPYARTGDIPAALLLTLGLLLIAPVRRRKSG